MGSPYLSLPLRSHEQATVERDEARSGGWPPQEQALWYLSLTLQYLVEAAWNLTNADKRLPIGDGMDDELKGLVDLMSDIRGVMKRLRP